MVLRKCLLKQNNDLLFLCASFFIITINSTASELSFADKVGSESYEFISNNFTKGFIENKGQIREPNGRTSSDVDFVFQNSNLKIYIGKKGLIYQFTKTRLAQVDSELIQNKLVSQKHFKQVMLNSKSTIETFRIDMDLLNANSEPLLETEDKCEDQINYYNYNTLNVNIYKKIIYRNIYPGIDWILQIIDGQLKYDFLVHKGANEKRIKMEFMHHERLSIHENGGLEVFCRLGKIFEKKPVSYQSGNKIDTKFFLEGNEVTFRIENYNRNEDLLIDPSVIWSTYYGDTGQDIGQFCDTDIFGNVYMGGVTYSNNNIALGGHQNSLLGTRDAYLVKFNANGVRIWATYYGGSGEDYGTSCSVNASGFVYLIGHTNSASNISSVGHQNTFGGGLSDGFLVKFNSNGIRQWATYYGGAGEDRAYGSIVDLNGNVFICGDTDSGNNIASGGHQNVPAGNKEAFLVKFNTNGLRVWGTYYGGSADEVGWECSADKQGNLYLTGNTDSGLNIAANGHQNIYGGNTDAFLVKFNLNGVRQWATYYGDIGIDWGATCVVDTSNNVYLGGKTNSSNNIAFGGHQNALANSGSNAFLVKFDSFGSRIWATYYGGAVTEAYGTGVDPYNNVFLAGSTISNTLIAQGGFQNTLGGNVDVFIAKFNSSGIRQWGTYCGGSVFENGGDFAFDGLNNIYFVGTTQSNNNIANNGYQNIIGGGYDAFLVKLCDNPLLPTPIAGGSIYCSGGQQVFSVQHEPGVTSYSWAYTGSYSGSSFSNTINLIPSTNGVLSVYSINSCSISLTQTLGIIVSAQPTISVSNGNICLGQSFSISPIGASTYSYSGGSSVVSPSITSTYSVIGVDTVGCVSSPVSLTITVYSLPILSVQSSNSLACIGETVNLIATGAINYTWSTGAINNSISISPNSTSVYLLIGSDTNSCLSQLTFTQFVDPCSEIKENEIVSKYIVSPNPSDSKFILRRFGSKVPEGKIRVFDIYGRVIIESKVNVYPFEIELTTHPKGVYLLIIYNGEETRKIKLILE